MTRRYRAYRPSRWVRLAWAMLTGRIAFVGGRFKDAEGNWQDDLDERGRPSRHVEKYPRDAVWAILGPHPVLWWWVRKWGRLPCHCLRNPLTRRMVAYAGECRVHASWSVE